MPDNLLFIKRFILRKLANFGKFGGAHTSIFNLSKGLPNHLRGNKKGQKEIEQSIKELIQENLLLSKISTGEIHVSINPKKIKEVRELLELETEAF